MISSMTAFARVQIQEDWGSLVWEIRSVNHRYLEPHFHLTEQARKIEPTLRELIRKQLRRGKIECSLKYQLVEKEQVLDLNRVLLEKLQQAVREVETYFSQVAPVNPFEILQWPGVQSTEETEMAVVHRAAIKEFNTALIQLNEMRKREGQELQSFIETKLNRIGNEVRLLRVLLPKILQSQRKKILDRLSEAKQELNPERLEQEMVLLAQKMDVDEELDRIETHIVEVRQVLENSGQEAVGRRLDFLMQELTREANTLSSKSIHAGITQIAVNLKVFIEKIREQVQNIE